MTESIIDVSTFLQGFFSKLGSDEELSLDAKRTLVRAKPYLTIIHEKEARPLMAQIVETAHQEEGCLFYGWHMEGMIELQKCV